MPLLTTFPARFTRRGAPGVNIYDPFAGSGTLNFTAPADHGGISPLAWYASTWTRGGNAVTSSPGLGAELLTNPDFELDANWTNHNTPTVNERSNEQAHGGTYSRKVVGNAITGCRQDVTTLTVGAWYQLACHVYPTAGRASLALGGYSGPNISALNTWTRGLLAGRADLTSRPASFYALDAASTFYADDASLKRITDADLFASLPVGDAGAGGLTASVALNHSLADSYGNYCGLVCNLDSAVSPQNYVLLYARTYTLILDKVVNGVPINLVSASIVHTPGARMALRRVGNTYTAYYNGAQVGAAQTISDAGIINNTRHGLFATLPTAGLSNYRLRSGALPTVCVIGDSLSNDATSTTDWPYYLVREAAAGTVNLKNHAVSGQAIMSGMDAETVAAAADDADVIIILLGVNDSSTTGLEAEYLENLLELQAGNPRATIYAVGILPTTTQDARRVANNPLIASAAATAGVTYLSTDGWLDPAADTSDGVHTIAAGAAKVWAALRAATAL